MSEQHKPHKVRHVVKVDLDGEELEAGFETEDQAFLFRSKMTELVRGRSEIERLRKALEPFAQADLCSGHSNCKRPDDPVFGKDDALLLLRHFTEARAALEEKT